MRLRADLLDVRKLAQAAFDEHRVAKAVVGKTLVNHPGKRRDACAR